MSVFALVKAAGALGVPVGEIIESGGGGTLAPAELRWLEMYRSMDERERDLATRVVEEILRST